MSSHKTAKNVAIRPWLSANKDCRDGRFIQVGNSLLLSDAFKSLDGNAQKTYFALCMESGGKPTAELSRAGAKKYGLAPATFSRAIRVLMESGFISCSFEENPFRYKTNVYRFVTGCKT